MLKSVYPENLPYRRIVMNQIYAERTGGNYINDPVMKGFPFYKAGKNSNCAHDDEQRLFAVKHGTVVSESLHAFSQIIKNNRRYKQKRKRYDRIADHYVLIFQRMVWIKSKIGSYNVVEAHLYQACSKNRLHCKGRYEYPDDEHDDNQVSQTFSISLL